MTSWTLPQNNVTALETGHLSDHDDIYTDLTCAMTGVQQVVSLTDASTVSVNAASGSDFRLTMTSGIGATRIIGTPSNPSDGQQISVMLTQDSSGGQLATWSSAWQFPASGTPLLSSAPSFTDILFFRYNAALSVWLNTDFKPGYAGSSTTVFYDDFASVPSGSLPPAQNWAISVGPPTADPTNGSQYYDANPNVLFVNSSSQLVFQVQANGGTTLQKSGSGSQTVSQGVGNYLSGRVTTFPEVNGPGGGQLTWSQTRPGFQPFQATYGTLTVSAKITPTAGFWPAIWVYGTSQTWPQAGEIDLMENFGGTYGGSFLASHGYFNIIGPRNIGDYDGADYEGTQSSLDATSAVINDGAFHTYQMTVNSSYNSVSCKMDGTSFTNSPVTESAWLSAMTTAGYPNAIWPFGPTQPLGIVLNVAVGSATAPAANVGYPSGSLNFPVTIMTIASVQWTIP